MAVKKIYSGPSRGLYRPTQFLLFMDQGQSGSHRRPVELLDFKYGTTLVGSSSSERFAFNGKELYWEVWHVHHYGVTVDYFRKADRVEVILFGEDIPLRDQGILSHAPIIEVERIIKKEAENPRYARMELESRI